VLDRNQAEQGGTGGSGPQLLGSAPQFITRMSSYSQLFSSRPHLLGSGSQDWFLLIGSSYFATTRSGPMYGS
jgi:hypothetical protein